MNKEQHRWYSQRLGREMNVLVYGHYGQPRVGFPPRGGDESEGEGQGRVGGRGHHLHAGRVEMVIATVSTALPHMKGGKARALAVTGPHRTPLLPQLPTMIEAGVKDYEVTTWYMLLAPARTPRPIVSQLSDALRTIASGHDIAREFAPQGLDPVHSSPDQAAAFLKSEVAKWGPAVKASGAKPE